MSMFYKQIHIHLYSINTTESQRVQAMLEVLLSILPCNGSMMPKMVLKQGSYQEVWSSNAMVQEEVRMRFDGVIYLTDGYANTPTVLPYCKMLWILTPNGSDEYLKGNPKGWKDN